MEQNSRKIVTIAIIVCTALLIISVTAYVTAQFIFRNAEFITTIDETDSAESSSRYDRLDEVYQRLMNEYYIELDSDTLLQGAIDGMMASVDDPYTFYYTPEQMEQTNSDRVGHYVGIGIQVTVTEEGKLQIVRVFNGPSKEAGLKNGDLILSADDTELVAFNNTELTEAVSHIKGEAGTYVHLTVERGNELLEFDVMRDEVISERVFSGMVNEKIGYIQLTDFFGESVSEMKNAVDTLIGSGAEGIILDLRENGGGQLDICLDITDLFLPESLIVYTEDRAGEREFYYADSYQVEIPLVVLINENSASASEIVASALKENGRATIIGSTSYGKGIVQSLYVFPGDGAGMQLTTSAYYTPNGNSIHKVGVEPDIFIEDAGTRFVIDDPEAEVTKDNAMVKAMECLLEIDNEDSTDYE